MRVCKCTEQRLFGILCAGQTILAASLSALGGAFIDYGVVPQRSYAITCMFGYAIAALALAVACIFIHCEEYLPAIALSLINALFAFAMFIYGAYTLPPFSPMVLMSMAASIVIVVHVVAWFCIIDLERRHAN